MDCLNQNPHLYRRYMKYKAYMTIYNSFEVEADNEEEATQKVRDLGVYETLDGADFNITEVELLKEEVT